jgi:pimeloyl-ACP methyl ester carboxylesterase
MPFVTTADEQEIYYEVHGEGPAIAFASGFMGITDIWREQVAALAGRYRCICFDNRGAGRSDKPFPRVAYGVSQHARDLHTVLEAVGVDRVVLAGHSMGGNTASLFYLAHPERVAGIAYFGSYVAGSQIRDVGNTLDVIKGAVRTKESRVGFYVSVGLPEDIAWESAKWPLYAVLGNAESFMEFDMTDRIGDIAVPTLIVHGDGDVVSPLDPCGKGLEAGLVDTELHVLPGVNHSPMIENPAESNRLLTEFLATRVSW